jgi:hypothetical protein
MGRQISFFMVNEDEQEFFKNVIESGDFLLDKNINRLASDNIKSCDGNIWIASPQSRITKTRHGFIDEERSEVIEFSRSIIIEPQARKTDEDIEKEKEARLKIVEDLNKLLFPRTPIYYPSLADKETVAKYRSLKRVLSGRLYVKTNYYSSYDENAILLYKAEWLIKKYERYKRWIIKYSQKNKGTGFGFYIGKETYRLYKEEEWRMMIGPILEAKFE